jgi:hypothetical protein
MKRVRSLRVLFFTALLSVHAYAHVGSADIYVEANAGPYRLNVVIRPPDAIPGIATLEVRALSPGAASITATPLPLVGEASKHPPVAQSLVRTKSDPQFYSGGVWLMSSGSWQIRMTVQGTAGPGEISVPVPSIARQTKAMGVSLSIALSGFGLLLIVGAIGICGACVGEAQLQPGLVASIVETNKRRTAMFTATLAFAALLVGGAAWWQSEATAYAAIIYKPLQMAAEVSSGTLKLSIVDPGWFESRRTDDFISDHGHLMHLYAVRLPEFDYIYHLHPEQKGASEYTLRLPDLPGGTYKLFADVVHTSGLPETITTTADLPSIVGHRPTGDDAGDQVTPLADASDASTYLLPDGYNLTWLNGKALHANKPVSMQFELRDQNGNLANDVVPYMGMAGHVAIIKHDASTFAHIHPIGNVNMAAFMMAQSATDQSHDHAAQSVGSTVSFPYGFATAGNYRIIVQMKHSTNIETAVFDALVLPD